MAIKAAENIHGTELTLSQRDIICNDINNNNIAYSTIKMRISRGMNPEKARSTPVQIHRSSHDYNVGETKVSLDNKLAILKEYVDWQHVIIEFQDGSHKTISAQRWRDGEFTKSSYRDGKTPQRSLNECAAYYYLKQIGFQLPDSNMMKSLGFEQNMSFDAYNASNKIAFEYDGMGHSYFKDHKKNMLCYQLGITLFRIRETRNCESLTDELSIIIPVNSSSWLTKEYENALKTLFDLLSKHGLPKAKDIQIDFKRDRKAIFEIYSIYHSPRETKREKERKLLKEVHRANKDKRNKQIIKYTQEHQEQTYAEIAASFAVSDSTLWRILKQAGISRYTRGKI